MQKIYSKSISFCCALGLLLIQIPCLYATEESMSAEKKMAAMQINLPKPATSLANYLPYMIIGKLVFISGNTPMEEGVTKFPGKVGENLSVEDAKAAARLCALNVLAQLKAAIGSLDKVKKVVQLTGFLNSTPDFKQHPNIMNGASDLIVSIFGDKGKHARAVVGVNSLPLGAAIEIQSIFEIE